MTGSIVDIAALRRLLATIGGDFEDLDELRDDFMSSAPDLVAQMHAAIARTDAASLRVASHTLKSHAREFGLGRLHDLCAIVERTSSAGTIDTPDAHMDAIAEAEREARAALERIGAADVAQD